MAPTSDELATVRYKPQNKCVHRSISAPLDKFVTVCCSFTYFVMRHHLRYMYFYNTSKKKKKKDSERQTSTHDFNKF